LKLVDSISITVRAIWQRSGVIARDDLWNEEAVTTTPTTGAAGGPEV
jgi:hypothetical protein